MSRIQQSIVGVKYSAKKDPLFGVSKDLRRLQKKEALSNPLSVNRRKWNHNAVVCNAL